MIYLGLMSVMGFLLQITKPPLFYVVRFIVRKAAQFSEISLVSLPSYL